MAIEPSGPGEPPRRTREALRQSEERFRLLVEGVKDYAIFMLDAEGYVNTWNEGARRIKGYDSEEILGEHFSVFYTLEDTEREHPEEELRIAEADGSYEEEGLEGVMNSSPYAIASRHGFKKTIPQRRFRRRVGICCPLPGTRSRGRPSARARSA